MENEEKHQAEEIKRREEFDQYCTRFAPGNYQTNDRFYQSKQVTNEEFQDNKYVKLHYFLNEEENQIYMI